MILKPAADAAAGFVGWVASVEIISSRPWSPWPAWYAFMIRTLAKMAWAPPWGCSATSSIPESAVRHSPSSHSSRRRPWTQLADLRRPYDLLDAHRRVLGGCRADRGVDRNIVAERHLREPHEV